MLINSHTHSVKELIFTLIVRAKNKIEVMLYGLAEILYGLAQQSGN